jgi:hypothetical protein
MVSALASSAAVRGFLSRSGQTRDYKINMCLSRLPMSFSTLTCVMLGIAVKIFSSTTGRRYHLCVN